MFGTTEEVFLQLGFCVYCWRRTFIAQNLYHIQPY
jgi:DNA-directed RNA polymerase subunit N (RpoN/RPB10)